MDVGSFTGTCSTNSGAGSGGTVTSITEDVNLFPEVLVNGIASYTITSSGTFVWSKVAQAANTFWAGPTSGAAAVPVFRGLRPEDGNGSFWRVDGNTGTSTGGGNYLGTQDGADFAIRTAAQEAIRVGIPGSAPGRVGIATTVPQAQLEVYRNNNFVVGSTPDLWSFRTTNIFEKWQPVPYIANSCYVGWHADPAGYAPAPTKTYGSGADHSFDITTQGDPAAYPIPAGDYFEYSGISINMNYTAQSGGGAGQVSDGQSGGFVYDGHLNKPGYVAIPTGGIKQQIAGNVKLAELGMHNAVSPYRGGINTVSEGIQMNLSDKPVTGPSPAAYSYVIATPGSTAIAWNGGADFTTAPIAALSTVTLNGTKFVVASVTNFHALVLSTPYTGIKGKVVMAAESDAQVFTTNGLNTVSWVSGVTFGSGWTGYAVVLGGAMYYIASIAGPHNLVLTGNFTGATGTTNARFYSIYVAQQDNAIHIQTHADDRNWNSTLLHNHGFGVPCADESFVKTLISGDGGLFNRFVFIKPSATSWSPGANFGTGTPSGIGSALVIDESATPEMLGGLMTMYSDVKAAQPFIYLRQDTSTYVGNMIQAQMATDGAGAASGGFTGNYFAFYKKGGSGSDLKIWGEHNGNLHGRFLDVGPRADTDGVPTGGAVSVSDANYTSMAGNMVNIVQAAASARYGIYQRNDTAAYNGSFLGIAAGTDAAGAPSGSFTGQVLMYQYPQGTVKAFMDYRPQLVMAAIAAPGAYGATFGQIYFDTADQKWHVVDGAGNHAL